MQKTVLSIVLVFCLVLSYTAIAAADSGFWFGLGYEELNNTFSANANVDLAIPDPPGGTINYLGLDFSAPAKMYSVDLGYDFNDNFALTGKYAWGATDWMKLTVGGEYVYSPGVVINSIEVPVTQDNQLWQVEAVYKALIGDSFKIGGIIGYINYYTTFTGTVDVIGFQGSIKSKQSFDGPYLGALIAFKPAAGFEIGATYRYLISPSGKLDASMSYFGDYSYPLNNIYASILDIYGKAAISKSWSAKAGYTYSWSDYKTNIEGVATNLSNKSSGLWVKLEYKF